MTVAFIPRSNRRGVRFGIAIGVVTLLIGGIWLVQSAVQQVERVREAASRMASV